MAKKDKDKFKKRKQQENIKVPTNCPFCARKIEPDYKDYRNLSVFLSERAKIIGIARSGVCSKHQRRLTIAVKRARHLGLLPFTPSI